MILGLLAQEKGGLASYALVCKEWMEVIEKRNFSRLKLRSSCLDDLEHMVSRRKGLVRHIWLNIELRSYTCRSCRFTESRSWFSSNTSIISRAISKLFTILATWNATGDGLTLELSAQSPSDAEHWFKNCYFGTESETQPQERIHDPTHGWVDGQQVASPSRSAVQRLYEWIRLSFREELPVLHAVTKLVLRRQFRRRIAYGGLRLLLDKLPRLECMVYEPWQVWARLEQQLYDEGKQSHEYRVTIPPATSPRPHNRIIRLSNGTILATNVYKCRISDYHRGALTKRTQEIVNLRRLQRRLHRTLPRSVALSGRPYPCRGTYGQCGFCV